MPLPLHLATGPWVCAVLGAGCLEAAVVRELIGQLKRGSPMRRMDMLAALRVALHTWAAAPEFQVMPKPD